MTIYRNQATVEKALLDVLPELSERAVAAATGKSPSHFYKVSNPQNDLSLSLRDAAALDVALMAAGKPAVFAAVYEEAQRATLDRLGGSQPAPKLDIAASLRRAHIEAGHLAQAVDDALADDRITIEERRRIAKEAQDLIDAARQLRDTVEPPDACGCGDARVVADIRFDRSGAAA